MLFRKKIEQNCIYCVYSAQLDNGMILCSKKGMVSSDRKCRAFRYDPCKRVPPKPKALDFAKYDQEDYSL